MRTQAVRTFAALVPLLTVSACGGGHDTSTPEGAVAASFAFMEDHDLASAMTTLMPPAQLTELENGWKEVQQESPDAEEALQFKVTMLMLTADDAEEEIFALIQPQLAEAQQALGAIVGLATMASMNAASDELNEEEREQYQTMMSSMASWMSELDLTDEAKAKEAIGIVCEAARDLDLGSLKEFQELSFKEVLDRGGIAFGCALEVFDVYGLDMDAMLDSAEIGKAVIDGSSAKVPVSMTMFGTQHEYTVVLQLIDGSWYVDTPEEEEFVYELK